MCPMILDATRSKVGFSVRHLMFSKVQGRFSRATATLDLASRRVRAAIDASSIDTGESARDDFLRSAEFFDVSNFQSLIFLGSGSPAPPGGVFLVIGALTIRDISREVSLSVRQHGALGDDSVRFSATTEIFRRDFGLVWTSTLEAGSVLVGERVEVDLDLHFVRAR